MSVQVTGEVFSIKSLAAVREMSSSLGRDSRFRQTRKEWRMYKMERIRHIVCRTLLALCALTGALALAAPAAMAVNWSECASCAFGHGTFGTEEHEPGAMAVEAATGDLFAVDDSHQRVTRWTQNGTLISSFKAVEVGAPAEFEEANEYGAAVDNSSTSPSKGDLYVSQLSADAVYKFKPSGASWAYVGKLEIGELASGVAVDESGDVFVLGFNSPGHIHEFGPTGTSLGEKSVPKVEAFAFGLAMNAAGTRFLIATGGKGVIEAGVSEKELPGSVGKFFSAIAIDPASGNVYAHAEAEIFEWGPTGAEVTTEGFPKAAVPAESDGMAYSSVKTTPGGVAGVLYVANPNYPGPLDEVNVFDNNGEAISAPPPADVCVGVAKGGNYTESGCKTVAEKKGKPDHKGKYELVPADSCYHIVKHGNYTESGCKTVAGKTKKGIFTPDHKGQYELAP